MEFVNKSQRDSRVEFIRTTSSDKTIMGNLEESLSKMTSLSRVAVPVRDRNAKSRIPKNAIGSQVLIDSLALRPSRSRSTSDNQPGCDLIVFSPPRPSQSTHLGNTGSGPAGLRHDRYGPDASRERTATAYLITGLLMSLQANLSRNPQVTFSRKRDRESGEPWESHGCLKWRSSD